MSENFRFAAVIAASVAILFGFNFYQDKKKSDQKPVASHTPQKTDSTSSDNKSSSETTPPPLSDHTLHSDATLDPKQALAIDKRAYFETDTLKGSVNLTTGNVDDLVLKHYKQTTEKNSPNITLLSPNGTQKMQRIHTSWRVANKPLEKAFRIESESKDKIVLLCDVDNDLQLKRTISFDKNYLITYHDAFHNASKVPIVLERVSSLYKTVDTTKKSSSNVHEGVVGYLEGKLFEGSFDSIKEESVKKRVTGGWCGLTDQFFLVALLSEQKKDYDYVFCASHDKFIDVSCRDTAIILQPESILNQETHFFAGPKVVRMLDLYETELGVPHLDMAVDFGWFYFLTKPLFFGLEYLHRILGNLGWAIIVMTLLFKIATFPFSYKSIRSMKRMKALAPQIEALKQRYGSDQMEFLKQQRALYKRENVSPMGGCLPMLLQAPLFFCLYKVFLISIETRHAPFLGWILDLSAPDPLSVFNLFGLLPFTPPSLLMVGPLAILMGITMLLQQKMSPQTGTDPSQQKAMMIMPLVFTFLFASFPAGLVLYWTFSNVLSIAQQWVLEKKQ